MQKFTEMVKQFVAVVKTIAEQIGKVVQFAEKVIGVISTVAKIVAVFV